MNYGNGYVWDRNKYVVMCKEIYINDYETSLKVAPTSVIAPNALENLEFEQIDNKLLCRFALRFNVVNYAQSIDPFVRNQGGFIYYSGLLDSADLVVFYTDYDYVKPYAYGLDKEETKVGHRPRDHYRTLSKAARSMAVKHFEHPLLFTGAVLWEQAIKHRPSDFVVAVLEENYLQLQTVSANTLLWTDQYELPPIPVDTLNKLGDELYEVVSQNEQVLLPNSEQERD